MGLNDAILNGNADEYTFERDDVVSMCFICFHLLLGIGVMPIYSYIFTCMLVSLIPNAHFPEDFPKCEAFEILFLPTGKLAGFLMVP